MKMLKICSMDLEKNKVVVLTPDNQEFTMSNDDFGYIIETSRIENGVIYGDFEIVEVRKKPTVLSTKSSKYYKTLIANKIKTLKPIKNLEVGKVYHSKKINEVGENLYLYLGKNYFSQIGYEYDDENFEYSKNPCLKYGNCFLEISCWSDTFLLVGGDDMKMAMEATPLDIEKCGKHKFEIAKSFLDKIFIFGDKEYVENKIAEAKLMATK